MSGENAEREIEEKHGPNICICAQSGAMGTVLEKNVGGKEEETDRTRRENGEQKGETGNECSK